ncbi:hypothetical protein PpBr36_07318 [Pyricularia pennisetigena]|uniref:hypothetical protein n=1 Tax=Pyricularia pennisetigena TaxID=1578925 RepID=UPI00114DCFE4|nr:hypothetical protein PpBr36_07318 [Pyricularia pennisetigena]TLS24993.1 hypothetical protein PpBr36_07318 [Pyricularia pennisetigena]
MASTATQPPTGHLGGQPTRIITSDLPQSYPSSTHPDNIRRFSQPANVEPPPPRVVSSQPSSGAFHRSPVSTEPMPSMYSPAQPQPSPSTGLPGRPRNRPSIMDPPGNTISSPARRGSGYPSPTIDHETINPKFVDDVARITYAIQQSLGDAVRRAIRDNWEKCLLGTDFHQAFVLNASIHHATVPMTKRAIRDFGSKMVKAGKADLLEHFSQADLDVVSDTILAKASHSFLDKALELRLRTIEAKPLVDALSRAERLGYESNDVVEQNNNHQERVIPSDSPTAARRASYVSAGASTLRAPVTDPTASWQCSVCYRTFKQESAYNHHMQKQVCTRAPALPEGFRYSCTHCGQGFTTTLGLQYHLNNKVCGDFGPTPAEQGMDATATAAAGAVAAAEANAHPRVVPVQFQHYSATPQRTAPFRSATSPPVGTPDTAGEGMGRITGGSDPYAHLTQGQRESLQEELRQAEIAFASRFKAAEAIADLNERRVRIDSLRNGFGTKQSMIRKKYGVRLRERRTKKEIEAERERMGRQHEERYDRGALDDARRSLTAIHGGVPRPVGPGRPPTTYSTKPIPAPKPAASVGPGHPAAHSTTPVPVPTTGATNSRSTPNMNKDHVPIKRELDSDASPIEGDPKRRRVDGEGKNSNDVVGSVQQSRAGEESVIVASVSQSPQSQDSDSQDSGSQDSGSQSSGTPERQLPAEAAAAQQSVDATATAPAAQSVVGLVDEEDDEGGSSDESEDDDEGIPAVLPATMRQGLSQTGRGTSNA